MLGKKVLLILLALCCLLFAALFYTQDPLNISPSGDEEVFIPGLAGKLADVKTILINSPEAGVELVNHDQQWLVKSKVNYPADVNAVRQLLYGVAQLQILEVKTSNELLLGEIGLAKDDEDSVRIRFNDENDDSIADVLFGKSQAGLSNEGRDWFVRQYKSPQSWLVNGNLNLYNTAFEWVNKDILVLAPDSLKQVELNPESDDAIKIIRTEQGNTFTIADLQEGEDEEPYKIDQLINSVNNLRFDDVRPRSETVFGADIKAVNVETVDGLIVFILITDAEQGWIVLQAIAGTADEAVIEKAQRFNQLWTDWEYQLPKFKIEQLLNDKPDFLTSEETS